MSIQTERLFDEGIRRFDAANGEDPRTEIVDGRPQPRELIFSQRVYEWVRQLAPNPSEELLLAARAHTLRRWLIPREQYPKTTIGYHEWRDALARFHAEQAESILREVGYAPDKIRAVRAFITKENWPSDPEARTLEDADCLVFLETKLAGYVEEWGEGKTIRILQRTIRKMTPEGRVRAMQLKLGARELELVLKATRSARAAPEKD